MIRAVMVFFLIVSLSESRSRGVALSLSSMIQSWEKIVISAASSSSRVEKAWMDHERSDRSMRDERKVLFPPWSGETRVMIWLSVARRSPRNASSREGMVSIYKKRIYDKYILFLINEQIKIEKCPFLYFWEIERVLTRLVLVRPSFA